MEISPSYMHTDENSTIQCMKILNALYDYVICKCISLTMNEKKSIYILKNQVNIYLFQIKYFLRRI